MMTRLVSTSASFPPSFLPTWLLICSAQSPMRGQRHEHVMMASEPSLCVSPVPCTLARGGWGEEVKNACHGIF
ncbi:hypothetical protein EDB84DRAFT_1549899 [Lactarius hengduanensis]|nr:hypothetical protein EDB84DRAFT_1549899 [Lactarius hengduanensis]